jgi:hypothetical protein
MQVAGDDDFLDEREVELALGVMQNLFEDEVGRIERLVSRSRQAFALAVAIFALAQTVALGPFQAENLATEHERRVLLVLAAISALATVLAGIAVVWADEGIEARHLPTESVLDAVRQSNEEKTAAMVLLGLYTTAVDEMRLAIQDRGLRVAVVQYASAAALALALIEVVYSLYHRLG